MFDRNASPQFESRIRSVSDPVRYYLGDMNPLTDPRWTAVAARDADADGKFVYSVASTGVYCLPSCPSRTAKPENVQFHATCDDAEQAGFRPCKRCNPRHPDPWREAIVAACRQIESSLEPVLVGTLARAAGMSASHFHRRFRAATGLTPLRFAAAVRAARIRDGLQRSGSVTSAIYDAGYGSSSRFYEKSDQILGMTPSQRRKGAAITYGFGGGSLGTVLVARGDRGICAILLGDDPDALVADLRRRFPAAQIAAADGEFAEWIDRVVQMVDSPRDAADLPLDIQGTVFQTRVWEELRKIPVGQTATYAEIAVRVGKPSASRAVANACAANKLAVAIPCHRIVKTGGDLSGYRWGAERKRALLEREKV